MEKFWFNIARFQGECLVFFFLSDLGFNF